MAAEAEPRGGRLGQVVLAPADVRPAIDHRHAHLAVAALERDHRAARQRLVRDAEAAGVERAAAARAVAVETGPVPRGVRHAVDVQAAEPALARHDARGVGDAHAYAPADGAPEALAQPVAAGGVGAIALEGVPASVAPRLERDRQAGDRRHDAARDDRAPAGADVQPAVAHGDL